MTKAVLIAAWLCLAVVADRRIVDRVVIGDSRSEHEHACASASGWTRCALTVFDDTEVAISATFGGTREPRAFDLVVENRTVGSYAFNSPDSATVEMRVPRDVTGGRTNIIVMLRGSLPPLRTLRSIQDHNE